MAFAGTFGAAGALIPFGMLASKQFGGAIATGYDANGNLQFTINGTVVTPQRINDLFIVGTGNILAALVNNTDDGSAADTGFLTTGAPAANQHGIPANFGLGRGNWNGLSTGLGSVKFSITQAVNTVAAATNTGGPVVRGMNLVLAPNNITIVVKNMSEVALASANFRLQMEHSIQP